eukprot:3740881-Pleurochrysis_carterae.AAC.1
MAAAHERLLNESMLAERREVRSKEAILRMKKADGPGPRSSEEWDSLSGVAERKARIGREITHIRGFLKARLLRPQDLCTALHHLSGYLDEIWGQKEMNQICFDELRCVMADLEANHFGERFGLHLHYEAHLTLNKI